MQDLNLAVIGNCTLGALIDRRGRYVWCCYPRLDGDPIFCNLLRDAAGDGLFDVEIERLTRSHQYYLGNSAILITELTDEAGATLRITGFAPRFKHYERVARPTMLIRQIEPVAGTRLVRIRTRPRFGYGSIEPSPVLGSNHLSFVSADLAVRFTTDAPVAYLAQEVQFALQAPVHIILGPDETTAETIEVLVREYRDRTEAY